MADWRKYPFLHGLKKDDAEYACDVVEGFLSDQEKEEILEGILPYDQFQQYLRWRSGGQDAPTPAPRKASANAQGKKAPTVSKEDFLKLMQPGIRKLAEKKLEDGEYIAAKELIFACNPQAGELFQKWRAETLEGSALPQNIYPIPPKDLQRQPEITLLVKVPYFRVKSLNWPTKFGQLKNARMKLDCEYVAKIENDQQVISVRGKPKLVETAVTEVWAFIAKTMDLKERLPLSCTEMITQKWPLNKRIAFMNKYQVDLWVGSEAGAKFVQINAWTVEDMEKAKQMLNEEVNKVAAQNGIPKAPAIGNIARFPPALNILVLGQSGIGKSTFINSVANYLMYKTFKESMKGQLKILIKFLSPMMDAKGIEHHVKMVSTESDTDDNNERIGSEFAGQSATQRPKSYVLKYGHGKDERIIRFIDTPGVLDTAGIERDKEIMNQNMAYLANFPTLHAILILMNPIEPKLTPGLKYCVNELLSRLHKNASQNILFCFPRTGNNFFKEGDGRITLERLVRDIQQENGVRIPLVKENKFTYENMGFTIRCQLEKARQGGFTKPSPELQEAAHESWGHSAQETIRLFTRILSLPPNDVTDHLNVLTIRETVAALARPMSEVIRNQLINRELIGQKRREIEMLRGKAADLRGKLHFNHVAIRTVPLEKPQTVCTSTKCTEYKKIGGQMEQPVHTTICHKNCHLVGVQEQVVNNPNLRHCAVFNNPGYKCEKCGCEWTMHQHVRWEIEAREETRTNRDVEHEIGNVEDNAAQAERFLRNLEEQDKRHERGCLRLAEIGAMFVVFLKRNCITSHNDAFKEHLDAQIQQEEMSVHYRGAHSVLCKELKKYRDEYEKKILLYVQASKAPDMPDLAADNLRNLITELKENEDYGQFLRDAQTLEINSSRSQTNTNEVNVNYTKPFTYML